MDCCRIDHLLLESGGEERESVVCQASGEVCYTCLYSICIISYVIFITQKLTQRSVFNINELRWVLVADICNYITIFDMMIREPMLINVHVTSIHKCTPENLITTIWNTRFIVVLHILPSYRQSLRYPCYHRFRQPTNTSVDLISPHAVLLALPLSK